MAKEVKVVELTPEQVQMLVEQQKSSEIAEQQQSQQEMIIKQAIINMSPDEIADYLAEHLAHTNVVVEALNLIEAFNLQEAVFVASLNRSRLGLDAAISWIENHFSLNEKQEKEDEKGNKTKSPEPQKEGKRFVYGAGASSLDEDDSEQL